MSNPTAADVHVDAALTDLAQGYVSQNYIWDQVAPVVTVDKQSDKYFVFDRDDMRRDEIESARAPGTVATRGQYELSTDSYYCQDWAWGKQTADETNRNADAALNLQQTDTFYCTDKVNLKIELNLATACFATSIWDTDIAGGAAVTTDVVIYWSTYATSTPIADVRAQADSIQKETGQRPNRMILGREVLSMLFDHPDFVDRLNVGATREVTLAALAQLFEVDQVVVGGASYNSAAKDATAVGAFAWGKNALLYYVPAAPSKDVPSAMYNFRWGPRSTLLYRDTPAGKMADVVEVHDYVDTKITGSDLGVFFSAIIA